MDKHIGKIFVQRTLKQSRPGRHTPCRATKAIFWKIIEVTDDVGNCIRCKVENDNGDKHRGRFGERTDNKPGMELRIINHYENDYECYGSSGIAYNKDCFNFPLKDYHNAHDWMQEFHCKLGHPVPDGHWYDGTMDEETLNEQKAIQAYETRDEEDQNDDYYLHNNDFVWDEYRWRPTEAPTEDNYKTPKRKRSVSVETFPPTPKKVKIVGRFTVTDLTDDEIHHTIKQLQEELKNRVIETNAV